MDEIIKKIFLEKDWDRNRNIYTFHKEGLTYRKIASKVGISATHAFNIVNKIDYERLSVSKNKQ